MSLWVKILVSLVAGLGLGIFLLGVGLGSGGIGHGWVTPLWFSFLGPVIYPVVIFRLFSFGDRWLGLDIGLLVAGTLLDLAVYEMTIEEGTHFFFRVGEIAYVWIGMWSLWQLAMLIKVVIGIWKSRQTFS